MVQQRKESQRTINGEQIEIGHAASEQRVPFAEIVMNAQRGHLGGNTPARFVHAEELGHDLAQGVGAVICTEQRYLRHGVAQHSRSHWMPLRMVGIQESFWRRLLN